ncbi:MAG: LamG domain-containing protein, partial [Candidatus Pacebacteria bacterium]|nr:LamG domain-containing protein [Candidatus Paceibacterota bacterium]
NGQLAILTDTGGWGLATASGGADVEAGKWYHVAVVRESATKMAIYLNGKLASTTTTISASDYNFGTSATTWTVGAVGINYFQGYIDEIRIVKGTAVYTGDFTPPTSRLTEIENTKLLIHSNLDSEGNTTFTDSATTGTTHTITASGGAIHSKLHGGIATAMTWPTSGKATGSAGCYLGGSDYLEIPDSADWGFGTGAFTIDFWLRPTAAGSNQNVIQTGNTGGNDTHFNVCLSSLTNGIVVKSGNADKHVGGTALSLNTWYHVAVVRDGSNNLDIYIDGAKSGTTFSTSWDISGTTDLIIGKGDSSVGANFTGYLDGLRISKGVTRWASAFTPPTQIYGALGPVTTNIGTITLTGSATPAADVAFTEKTSLLSGLGLTLTDGGGGANTATITGTLTAPATDTLTDNIRIQAKAGADDTRVTEINESNGVGALTLTNKAAGDIPVLFNARRYVGTDETKELSGLGFQPDLVWTKLRDAANSHRLIDSVRGPTYTLMPDDDGPQYTENSVTGFNSDGFTIGDGNSNDDDGTYIAWCWKAGGPAVAVTSGLSNTSAVTQSASTTTGLSISKYIGGSNTGTGYFPHNLGDTPSFIIVKKLFNPNAQEDSDFMVWHENLSADYNLYLNRNSEQQASGSTAAGRITAPTSTNITLSSGPTNSDAVNYTGYSYICYAWKAVDNVSAFGTYTGIGSRDMPASDSDATWCGFKPRFVLVKKISATGGWTIFDGVRDSTDEMLYTLEPDWNGAEGTQTSGNRTVTVGDNGFKVGSSNAISDTGVTFIWCAFA